MKKTTRKSTALVSLVLVPLNLMGLGFAGGCDSRDDSTSGSFTESTPPPNSGGDASSSAAGQEEVVDFDYRDPDDPFTLDPVTSFAGGPPATQPTTQPLATSNFAHAAPYHSGSTTHYRSGGMAFIPVPIPFRSGYRPSYPRGYRGPAYGSPGYRTGYPAQRPPTPSYTRPGSSVGSSSSGSNASRSSSSSGVSRGGFGSSGRASGSSSSSSSSGS